MLTRVSLRASRSTVTAARVRFYSSSSSYGNAERTYLEPRSIVPTLHFQPSLPRLPIPDLAKTLPKYLRTVEPLLTPEEFEQTKKTVDDFSRNEGPKIHAELVARDQQNKHTSFISAPWYAMYLEDRQPLPINYNPQLTMNNNEVPEKNAQDQRAASLVSSALRFYRSYKDGMLEPDIFHTQSEKSDTQLFRRLIRWVPSSISFYGAYLVGAYPLDMSQYERLFQSTRVPRKDKDELQTFPDSRHILVMRRNHCYRVAVAHENGAWYSDREILGAIRAVLNDDAPKEDANPIGIFTTENRNTWASYREELIKNPENAKSLQAIDSALFCLCLDDIAPTAMEKESRNFLFGNGRNRWFDKSVSVLVASNGRAAINFEHSWGDGVAVVRFMQEIWKDSNKGAALEPAGEHRPQRLTWALSPSLVQGIQRAAKRFDDDSGSMRLNVLTTEVLNRQHIKDAKVSPDGFLQMSFQLAYRRMTGNTVATYESANQAAFKHGRTEVIRSATNDSVKFTKAFGDPKATILEKNALLRQAINTHSKITYEAMIGQGIDRHLFAMKDLLVRSGRPLPAIYTDKAYQVLNHNILSTSTLASPALDMGGFGPVVRDGFGIGYGMNDTAMRFNVTSYLEVKPFLGHLEQSLKDMKEAILSHIPEDAAPKKSKKK